MIRYLTFLATFALLGAPVPAWSAINPLDTTILSSILGENTTQTGNLIESLRLAEETTALARETAGFAKESVQVGKNLITITTHPDDFFLSAVHGWSQSFPELQAILEDVFDARESIDAAMHPEQMPDYDPYAYVNAFDRLKNATTNKYEVMAHAVDMWGVNDAHDQAIASLQKRYEMSMENLRLMSEAVNASNLSPVQASIYSTQAVTIASGAQIEAAAVMHKIARTLELNSMRNDAKDAEAQKREWNVVEQGLVNFGLSNWDLDPMHHRQRIEPVTR